MSSRPRTQDTLQRLERWMREHQPAFLDAMNPGATDAELNQLERDIGRTLPDDVRAFYRWRNGLPAGVSWSAGAAGPFWQRPLPLDETRHRYEERGAYAEANWAGSEHPGWWHAAWVPIMSNDNGDFICVDTVGVWTGARGQIIRFWHDSEGRPIEAGSLGDWLRVLVIDLEHDRVLLSDIERADRRPHGYPRLYDAMEDPSIPEPTPPALAGPLPELTALYPGDRVRVTSGSFMNSEGEVKALVAGTWQVTVVLTFWGRAFDVELEHHQLALVQHTQQLPAPVDWSGCEDATQLFSHLGFSASVRKLRLLVAACCRDFFGGRLGAAAMLAAVEAAAEDESALTVFKEAAEDLWCESGTPSDESECFGAVMRAIVRVTSSPTDTLEAVAPTMVRFGIATPELIREIFPNPFVSPRFDPAWRTSDVIALAHAIYAQQAFDQMPVLADALQDAGCDNDDILTHCRDTSAAHVRGCWVLDLCLRRE